MKHKYIIVAILALLIILPMFFLKTTEHLTNCTALNQDPYSTGAHISCCDGLLENKNLDKYTCLPCMKEGDPAVDKSKFTMCCSGLIQDSSRPGYISCKSNEKKIFVILNGDKDDTKRWSKESKKCTDCGYSIQPGCIISQSNNCEILTTTLSSVREIKYPDVKNPTGNIIQYQNGTTITYYNVSLTDTGIEQSKSFETVLPKLALDIKAAPITKAIILDPTSPDSPANPFQTILPFLVKNKIQKVQFFGTSDYSFLNDMLDKNDGSIIIVGNADVLWGAKSSNSYPSDNSILSILGKLNNVTSMTYPDMGKTIYTFPNMKVYEMTGTSYISK